MGRKGLFRGLAVNLLKGRAGREAREKNDDINRDLSMIFIERVRIMHFVQRENTHDSSLWIHLH